MTAKLAVRRFRVARASLLFALLTADPAFAADDEGNASGEETEQAKSDESAPEAKSDEKIPDKAGDDAFGHAGQFGARLGIVGGYRMILRYEDSPPCSKIDPAKGENQPKFCGHGAPFALTTALSYGIADWLEPFAWGRFGLASETETYTKPAVMFGLGVRVYTMSDAAFKIFIEPAIGMSFEDGTLAEYDNDFVLHLAAGPALDFSRNVGVYLTGGVTAGILRALSATLDLELGLQGRF